MGRFHQSYFGIAMGAIIALCLSGCGLFSSTPSPAWNESQVQPIIEITNCCGFVPQIVPLNYIPDGQIWGDGRYLWVEHSNSGTRVVRESKLSKSEIEGLLERLLNAGFFQWRDEYADYSVSDLAWQCINVELIGNSKSVCEYFRGAPALFHEIYEYIALGLGMAGATYVPERAYMTSFPMDGIGFSQTPLDEWDSTSAGVDLADANNGIWVEGDALRQAWEIINSDIFSNMVESKGNVYQLTLQIPGVSMIDPEAF